MSGPASASKRKRLLQAKATEANRMMSGAVSGPVRWIDCRATNRRDPHAAALTGCRERLAEIRYEPDSVIAFEVLAPVRIVSDVIVLTQPAKAGQPATVMPPGARHPTLSICV